MHEAALAAELLGIIEGVADRAQAAQVVTARLEIGELACVEPSALEFAFAVVSRGTVADGCVLEISRIALEVRCPTCGWDGRGDAEAPGCPRCGALSVAVTSGRQMRVVSLEVEEGEEDA